MPDADKQKAAGYFDVSDWGEKDVAGAYPPGTTFELDGQKVDVSSLPDVIGGSAKGEPKNPTQQRRMPAAPAQSQAPRAPGADGPPKP